MVGFDDLDDQPDDAGGREELAALLPLSHCELSEEVFINLPESVPLCDGDRREILEQGHEQTFFQSVVGLWEHVLEVFVLSLNGFHRLIDGFADVGSLGQVQQG